MNCPKCNTLNADDLTFCTNCGFQFKALESKNSKNLLIIGAAVLIGIIGCCGVFGFVRLLNKKDPPVVVVSPPGNSTTPAANAPVSTKTGDSGITWKDYNTAFSPKNGISDQQKDLLWKNYDGRIVYWEGMVSDFNAAAPDVKIKMNAETLSYDIALDLKANQKSKLANLAKGNIIRFSGRLKTYGGSVLPLMMDDGEIR